MSRRFRPVHAVLVLGLVMAAVLAAEYVISGSGQPARARVGPDAEGVVRFAVDELGTNDVRFYRFLNRSNQEVLFFVARDGTGTVHVAFDAAESDYKRKLGFRHDGAWVVNNKCETACRLEEINLGAGGCRPVPLAHRLDGDTVILAESDVLTGWRYFQ